MSFECGNCERCPHVVASQQTINTMEQGKQRLLDLPVPEGFDTNIVPALFDIAEEHELQQEQIKSPEDLATSMRISIAQQADEYDDGIKDIKTVAAFITRHCNDGPTEALVIDPASGAQATVVICNSLVLSNSHTAKE